MNNKFKEEGTFQNQGQHTVADSTDPSRKEMNSKHLMH
jgi:hypothetical protein